LTNHRHNHQKGVLLGAGAVEPRAAPRIGGASEVLHTRQSALHQPRVLAKRKIRGRAVSWKGVVSCSLIISLLVNYLWALLLLLRFFLPTRLIFLILILTFVLNNNNNKNSHVGARSPCPEPVLWSYLTQLTAAVRFVHTFTNKNANGDLSLRCLSPHRVLVTSNGRLRISGVGVVDLLESDQVVGWGGCLVGCLVGWLVGVLVGWCVESTPLFST
jgi:hypothetical protein